MLVPKQKIDKRKSLTKDVFFCLVTLPSCWSVAARFGSWVGFVLAAGCTIWCVSAMWITWKGQPVEMEETDDERLERQIKTRSGYLKLFPPTTCRVCGAETFDPVVFGTNKEGFIEWLMPGCGCQVTCCSNCVPRCQHRSAS